MDQNLFTVVETRKIEEFCIETLSITEYDLMLRAGNALINYIKQVFPDKKVIQVVCGSGNNGGDGYTVARLLLENGKRVAFCRAVANEPKILLADEPTGNLDEKTSDTVFNALLSLVESSGMAALIATHNEKLVKKMNRHIRLKSGKLFSN